MNKVVKDSENRLSIRLSGSQLTANKFLSAVENLFGIMKDVSKDISQNKNAIQWIISVREGSAIISAEAQAINDQTLDIAPMAVKAIYDGLNMLEQRAERPPHFSDTTLTKAEKLASILDDKGEKVDQVQILSDNEALNLSYDTVAHVKKLLEIKTEAYGSIEGKLSMMSERSALRFHIYDMLTDQKTECHFDKKMLPEVIQAFTKRVLVSGLIKYREGGRPASIVKINAFRTLDEDNLPSFYDVKGIFNR